MFKDISRNVPKYSNCESQIWVINCFPCVICFKEFNDIALHFKDLDSTYPLIWAVRKKRLFQYFFRSIKHAETRYTFILIEIDLHQKNK